MLHQDTLYDHQNVIIDGKRFGAPSLDVQVDVRRLHWTTVNLSSRPIVKCKHHKAQVKRQAICKQKII